MFVHRGTGPRLGIAFAFFLLAWAGWAQSPALKPRVAVLRFQNTAGLASMDAACQALTKSLSLTLDLLGQYEVLPAENPPITYEPEGLRAWAEARRADYILYGEISQPSPGLLRCSLAVYDRAKGLSSIKKESEAARALEVFDAADEVMASVLQLVTGRHIGFGSVRFINKGVTGDYAVLLDGFDVGTNVASIDAVLNGHHTIVLQQRRMLGTAELGRWAIDVAEGESASLDFAIPGLLEAEAAKLASLEAAITAGWASAQAEVEARIAEYLALTKDQSYSTALAEHYLKARQLSGEWSLQRNRLEIEARAWDPDSELLGASMAAFLSAKSYPDPEKIRQKTRDNASLLAALLELRAGAELGRGDDAAALASLSSVLDFSAYLPDAVKSDFIYAAATLKDHLAPPTATRDGALKQAVFGDLILAGARFGALRDAAALPGTILVLPSDLGSIVDYGDGKADPGPRVLPRSQTRPSVQVSVGGVSRDIALAPGEAFLFVANGFRPFGRQAKPPAAARAEPAAAYGYLAFPWLPEGATVEVDAKPLALAKADDGSPVSANMLPNRYDYTVALGKLKYSGSVDLRSGRTIVPEPVDFLMGVLEAKKAALEKNLAGKSSGSFNATASVICFVGSALAGGFMVADFVSYQSASSIASALHSRTSVCADSLIAGATASLGFIFARSSQKEKASRMPPEQLAASIADLDRQIEELRSRQGVGK